MIYYFLGYMGLSGYNLFPFMYKSNLVVDTMKGVLGTYNEIWKHGVHSPFFQADVIMSSRTSTSE